ncbi:alpha/beta hydrolase [Paenibacillus turpanensis]|uniref:alpha/beta hydrolase n=1 Tax=Paenibacillus turpanensis TaxID=2689078 RepID=UPI00140900E9|nr:alpha/beta hydrolase family protein [Paenibacillus turpanensis]
MAWLHVQYHSESLRMPVSMEVLLPQHRFGGSRKVDAPGPYPTLYLLHGMGDDHTAWMRRTSVERHAEGLPLAIVMPAGHLGWYTDMVYGRDYFRFISQELPAVCERMFPLSSAREDRFIAGNSMGGYGALKAGLHAAETFRVAAGFSSAIEARPWLHKVNPSLTDDVFGSEEAYTGSVNDLFASAEKLARSGNPSAELLMFCGTEDFFYEDNVCFKQHLQSLGLPLHYTEGPGDHSWKYWDDCIEQLIQNLPLKSRSSEGGKQHGID